MQSQDTHRGPIMRLFQVHAKAGRAGQLIEKFTTTSAAVVQGEPGNKGYFFGQDVAADDDYVVFASIWKDLAAVKARFGADWQTSFLPRGYEAMIETHSVRHIDLSAGWKVDPDV